MRYSLVLVLWLLPVAAFADGDPADAVSQKVCAMIAEQKNADTGADYVAGVDVHGRKVVPADVSSATAFPPVVIPVTVDLADKFGITLPNGIELKPDVASFEISQSGSVKFNGRDITPRLRERCVLIMNPKKANGQETRHDIGSGDIIKGEYPENTPQYND